MRGTLARADARSGQLRALQRGAAPEPNLDQLAAEGMIFTDYYAEAGA